MIDPGLEWSTFLGGSNREEIHGLALTTDGSGDVVVAGHTFSSDFPTAPAGALGSSPLIPFVARLNAAGTELVYATLFGSRNGNVAYVYGLALDAASAPIVVGETNGADFPTTAGAYQPTFNEPSATVNRGWDAYVTRFDASGSGMVFSTCGDGADTNLRGHHNCSSNRDRDRAPFFGLTRELFAAAIPRSLSSLRQCHCDERIAVGFRAVPSPQSRLQSL